MLLANCEDKVWGALQERAEYGTQLHDLLETAGNLGEGGSNIVGEGGSVGRRREGVLEGGDIKENGGGEILRV